MSDISLENLRELFGSLYEKLVDIDETLDKMLDTLKNIEHK